MSGVVTSHAFPTPSCRIDQIVDPNAPVNVPRENSLQQCGQPGSITHPDAPSTQCVRASILPRKLPCKMPQCIHYSTTDACDEFSLHIGGGGGRSSDAETKTRCSNIIKFPIFLQHPWLYLLFICFGRVMQHFLDKHSLSVLNDHISLEVSKNGVRAVKKDLEFLGLRSIYGHRY